MIKVPFHLLQASKSFKFGRQGLILNHELNTKTLPKVSSITYKLCTRSQSTSKSQTNPYFRFKYTKQSNLFHTTVSRNYVHKMPKLSLKRRSTRSGWLLSGCCFSKMGKNETDEVTSEEGATEDTRLLISEERKDNVAGSTPAEERMSKNIFVEVHTTSELKQSCHENEEESETSKTDEKETLPAACKVRPEGSGKPRPNYFVAIQVDNPEIHDSLQHVQDAILEKKPLMKHALVSVSLSHITFVVMHIADKEDLDRASKALVECYNVVKEDLETNPLYLTFEGISHFRKKVLYADITVDEGNKRIYSLYKSIASCFEACGFDVKDKSSFTPHLTIAKLSKDPKLYKKGLKVISPTWYEEFKDKTFGVQLVKSLQLLRMDGPKDDKGYYQCQKECCFDLSSKASEAVQKKLSKSLEDKKEIRQKIHDLTAKKLLQNEK